MSFQEEEEEKSDNSIDVVTASALLNGDSLRCTVYREFQVGAHLGNIPNVSLGNVWILETVFYQSFQLYFDQKYISCFTISIYHLNKHGHSPALWNTVSIGLLLCNYDILIQLMNGDVDNFQLQFSTLQCLLRFSGIAESVEQIPFSTMTKLGSVLRSIRGGGG